MLAALLLQACGVPLMLVQTSVAAGYCITNRAHLVGEGLGPGGMCPPWPEPLESDVSSIQAIHILVMPPSKLLQCGCFDFLFCGCRWTIVLVMRRVLMLLVHFCLLDDVYRGLRSQLLNLCCLFNISLHCLFQPFSNTIFSSYNREVQVFP